MANTTGAWKGLGFFLIRTKWIVMPPAVVPKYTYKEFALSDSMVRGRWQKAEEDLPPYLPGDPTIQFTEAAGSTWVTWG